MTLTASVVIQGFGVVTGDTSRSWEMIQGFGVVTGDTSTSWEMIWGGDTFGRGSSIELHCMKILTYDFAHMQTQLSNENSASTINSFLYFSSLVSSCENIPSLSLKIMPCLSISFIKALLLLIFVNVIPEVKIMNYFASLSLFNRK